LVNPARKITNSGTKKNIGLFASHKMRTGIWFEFLIERDYMTYSKLTQMSTHTRAYQGDKSPRHCHEQFLKKKLEAFCRKDFSQSVAADDSYATFAPT
jgi:hypothetical protein